MNLTADEREEIADALNEVWAFMRRIAPSESGLDGWHNDCLLTAASLIRNSNV